uniref:Calcineurin-binding protein cabin-1 MEF2-binding domain-containing protein n=1 Tax=Amphimedon queenslandica TaxID=400682 RepID=A0A1X7UXN3_AMPQE
MIRFSALNKQDSDTGSQSCRSDKSSQPTREAQESALLKLYHEAVKEQQEGHLDKAKSLYCDILCSPVIENDEAGVLQKIKFFILKNLASIAKERDDMPTAVSAYLEASKIDDTDTLLWYQLAVAAGSLGDLNIMRRSLEKSIHCNNQYWPSVDLYFTVLLALKDYHACLQAVLMALQFNPHYSRGLFVLKHITKMNPNFLYQEPKLRIHLDANPVIPPNDKCYFIGKVPHFDLSAVLKVFRENWSDMKSDNAGATPGPSDIVSPSKEVPTAERKRRLQFDSDLYSAPKRRSTRVKGKEKETQDYFQMIRDYLPPHLRLSECPDLSQVAPLVAKSSNKDKEESSSKNGPDNSLNSFNESVIVKDFVESHYSNNGIVHLITEFLYTLSSYYDQRWSKTDPQIFIECYELVHVHLNYPSLFCASTDAGYADQLFMIALSYLELKIDVSSSSKSAPALLSSLPSCFNKCLLFVQYYQKKTQTSKIRVEWLKGKWASLKKDKQNAVTYFQKCSDLLVSLKDDSTDMETHDTNDTNAFPTYINLLNCNNDSIITEAKIARKIESLEQLISLEKVQLCYEKEELESVVDILLPSLSQESYTEFFLGSLQSSSTGTSSSSRGNSSNSSGFHGIQYLLNSLFKLNRYSDCYYYSVHFLIELLICYQRDGHSDQWCKSLSYLYTTISKCIDSETSLFIKTDSRVTQLLVISIIKTLYAVQELVDTPHSSHLPTILPWKLLHTVISFDEWVDTEVMSSPVPPTPSNLSPSLETPPPLPPSILPSLSSSVATPATLHVSSSTITSPNLSPSLESPPPLPPSILPSLPSSAATFSNLSLSLATPPILSPSLVTPPLPSSILPSTVTAPLNLSPSAVTPPILSPSVVTPPPLPPPVFPSSLPDTPLISSAIDPITSSIVSTPSLFNLTESPAPSAPLSPQTLDATYSYTPIIDTPYSTPSLLSTPPVSTPTPPTNAITPPTNAPTTNSPTIAPFTTSPTQPSPSPNITTTPSPMTVSPLPLATPPASSSGISFNVQPLSAPPAIGTCTSLFAPCPGSKSVNPLSFSSRRDVGLCFLKLAHDQLGSYSWCCQDKGSFLLYIVSQLRTELMSLTNLTRNLREMLLLELEQCYYCLYGYPSKKAKQKGLLEHNSEQIKINWSGALTLIEYFRPLHIPTIDDVKSPDVTPELINLYKRLIEVVPNEGKVVSDDDLLKYIEGSIHELMTTSPIEHTSKISEMYYLLADDSLKLMDNNKAIKYYQLTLCYSPDKFDSWAGLALAKSRKITDRIENRDLVTTVEKLVSANINGAVRCFQKALEINNRHCYVVEKFGFFCYAMQSFASQIKSLPQLYKSKGTQEWSQKLLPDKLRLAHDQFTHALSLEGVSHAEPWIYHFLLGKINWKLEKPLQIVLNHFIKSAEILHSEGAVYPVTVEVLSKGHAIQALEVHYHFMSVSLKALLSLPTDNHGLSLNPQSTSRLSNIREGMLSLRSIPLGRLHLTELWNWSKMILKRYYSRNDSNPVPIALSIATSSTVIQGIESTPTPSTGMGSNFNLSVTSTGNTLMYTANRSESASTSTTLISSRATGTGTTETTTPTIDTTTDIDIGATPMEVTPCTSVMNTESPIDDNPTAMDTDTALTTPIRKSPVDNIDVESMPQIEPIPKFSVSESPLVHEEESSDEENELSNRMNNVDPFTECLYGVSLCAVKFPAYYKPLYRLASTLYKMGQPKEAKKFLLGPLPKCFATQEKLQPIFALKSNIFQNMWQLKITEINRPGNFSSHARSCLQLLLQVLSSLNDFSSLLFIAQQLKNKPDQTKQYLREAERPMMYTKALHLCVQTLKLLTSKLGSMPHCHKLLINANTLRGLLIRAEGKKDESVKTTEQCMMKLFNRLWSDMQVRALFIKDGFTLPHEPTMDLCIKYCSLSKDKDFASLGFVQH